MNNAIPAKKPVKTVFDMNLTINPNLKTQDKDARTPAITATREAIMAYWPELTIIKEPSVEPTNMDRCRCWAYR